MFDFHSFFSIPFSALCLNATPFSGRVHFCSHQDTIQSVQDGEDAHTMELSLELEKFRVAMKMTAYKQFEENTALVTSQLVVFY